MSFADEYRDYVIWKSTWGASPEEYEHQRKLGELLDSAIESVNENKVTPELIAAVGALV